RLPLGLVRTVATPGIASRPKPAEPASSGGPAAPPRVGAGQCPICGSALPGGAAGGTPCPGCGAMGRHRRLALALYHFAREPGTRTLVLGADETMKRLCEDLEAVTFAEAVAEVPQGL